MTQQQVLDAVNFNPEQVGYVGDMIYNEIIRIKESDQSDYIKNTILGILNPIDTRLTEILKSYREV